MMEEICLTAKLPKPSHPVAARRATKTPEIVAVAKQFGREYFDGAREHGYGGYHYDGRWMPVVDDIIDHFDLKPGDRVLDVGCAKGFLVKDMHWTGLDAYGLDISDYALRHCHPDIVGRLHLGNAINLPFPSGSFHAVICINTVHNLPRDLCIQALSEIERVSVYPGGSFVQVGAYCSPEEKQLLTDWALTAETHGYPEEWRQMFKEAGYRGDYWWTITTPAIS